MKKERKKAVPHQIHRLDKATGEYESTFGAYYMLITLIRGISIYFFLKKLYCIYLYLNYMLLSKIFCVPYPVSQIN